MKPLSGITISIPFKKLDSFQIKVNAIEKSKELSQIMALFLWGKNKRNRNNIVIHATGAFSPIKNAFAILVFLGISWGNNRLFRK